MKLEDLNLSAGAMATLNLMNVHSMEEFAQRLFNPTDSATFAYLLGLDRDQAGFEALQRRVAEWARQRASELQGASKSDADTGLEDHVALIDLDGTVAKHHEALQEMMASLASPGEPPYTDRYSGGEEPPHIAARRKLVQQIPGFWLNLEPIPLGLEVIQMMREIGYQLHVLTKGPMKAPNAWGEKVQWSQKYIPDALVNVGADKSLVYGRVLFDDWPAYFTKWLKARPRGLVICLAHPYNESYAPGGKDFHPNVLRYDGSNKEELRARLQAAYSRKSREPLAS